MDATESSTALAQARLRANPAYELVRFDALHPEQLAQLGSLPDDPELFGLLRPRDVSGRAKAVGHDTAALFGALADSSPVGELPDGLAADAETLERLVLGGVLELEDGGRFVSGPAAEQALSGHREPVAANGRLGRLSMAALRYGATLPIDDAGRLSARMYFFNRVPAGPRWRRLFPDGSAVRRFAGIDGRNRATLAGDWEELPPGGEGDWIVWRRRGLRRERSGSRQRTATYKLYVSPVPEEVGAAFDATVATLTGLELPSKFKVGANLHGFLRPDKLIVYLGSREELEQTAAALAPALGELRPHGVPFTAEYAGDGLLSWGVDPPGATARAAWWERESWRLWVTNRLAVAILSARAEGAEADAWRFALRRIEAEGVDLATWAPGDGAGQ